MEQYNYDEFDNLSDDNLWDILENFKYNDDDNDNNIIKDKISEKKSNTLNNVSNKLSKIELLNIINNDDFSFDDTDSYSESDVFNNYIKKCLECKSSKIIYSTGRNSYVCENCGIENQDIYDDNFDSNNNDDYKSESRKYNTFFPKSSLSTNINLPNYSRVKMLRNWSYIPYKERTLADVLNDIDNKCKNFKITKAIIDNAKILYKNIRDIRYNNKNVIIRGINRKQIIAACLFYGAILQKSPRSIKEISIIFDLELKQVSKGCRKFLEIMKDNYIVFDIKPFHGSDFIKRLGVQLKLPEELLELSINISNNSTKLDLITDHQALSIAAASILLATLIKNIVIILLDLFSKNENKKNMKILKENINTIKKLRYKDELINNIKYDYKDKLEAHDISMNKKIISYIFNISDVTITKTFKKLLLFRNIIIDNELTIKFYYKINNDINNPFYEDLYIDDNIDNLDESDIIKKENKVKSYLLVEKKEKIKKPKKIKIIEPSQSQKKRGRPPKNK